MNTQTETVNVESTETPTKPVKTPKVKSDKYQIQCVVTGQVLKRRPDFLAHQAEKYGFKTIEDLRAVYIGREARNLLKTGRTVEDIRAEKNCTITTNISEADLIRFRAKIVTTPKQDEKIGDTPTSEVKRTPVTISVEDTK